MLVMLEQSFIIDGEIRIAIQYQQRRLEIACGAFERSGSAEQALTFYRVVNTDAPAFAVVEPALNLRGQMTDAEYEVTLAPCARNNSIWICRNGSSPMGARPFGRFGSTDRKRVPNPPARITTGVVLSSLSGVVMGTGCQSLFHKRHFPPESLGNGKPSPQKRVWLLITSAKRSRSLQGAAAAG